MKTVIKLSTKGRYGLRAMLDLASNAKKGPRTIHAIAERQEISERYLEQLLIPLKQSGLVKSVRGPQGGYMLGRAPQDISVGDIIRVLEGPLSPVDCVSEQNPDDCKRADICVTRTIWAKVRDCIAEVLDSYSLLDLVNEARHMPENKVITSDIDPQ
jgi:Rrf2 family cysteine metabolism transcriptional repressor